MLDIKSLVFMVPYGWSWGIVLLGLCLLFFLISTLYNIFFHPLKHYAGPLLLASSKLPLTYHVLAGTSTAWLQRLHEKYGPVIRVAPNELSYADAESWKDIHGNRAAGNRGFLRDFSFTKSMEEVGGSASIVTSDQDAHSRIRRAWTHFFSKQALGSQEPLIVGHVDLMIQKCSEKTGAMIDITDMFMFTLFDIMADLQFGESLHLLEKEAFIPWVSSQFRYIKGGVLIGALANFRLINAIFQLITPVFLTKQREAFFAFSNARINHRLTMSVDRPDIVGLAFRPIDKNGLTEDEIRANAPLLMAAGSETTTTLVSGLLAHLFNHTIAFRQVKAEIRGAFKQSSDINMIGVNKLEYLGECIKETLRMYPSVPNAIPYKVPAMGAVISGQWVPGGTRVYNSPVATFQSSRYFRDPKSFHPERWSSTPEKQFENDQKDAFRPFATGPRDCPGQIMANYLARLIFCKLIFHFDLELCPESKTWLSGQRVWLAWEKPPLFVKLRPVTINSEEKILH